MLNRATLPVFNLQFAVCNLQFAICLLHFAFTPIAHAAGGKLDLTVIDAETGKPLACRMHLKNQAGRPQTVPKQPYFHDHFVFSGQISLKLPRGNYSFEIERGPEYLTRTGHFTINDFADDSKTVEMKRFIDMSKEGWWSGDLHVHRPVKDIELLMLADDLHVAPVITWWNQRNEWSKTAVPANPLVRFDDNRFYHLLGGEDEREGGALLFFNLRKPLEIGEATREYPSPMKFIQQARQQPGAWIDAEKPFWWDLPVWIASGQIDSIGLANNHMQREKMYEGEAWGKPRDAERLRAPLGNGLWSQEIYYHLLNCGLRIPPVAGSGSGTNDNPVGTNRVYVFCDDEFSPERWWEELAAGRVFVTNGPLLRPVVEGRPPGYVFYINSGGSLTLEIGLNLATRVPIEYLQIIKNGAVEAEVRLADWKKKKGRLPPIAFDDSGWFLVRAVTTNGQTHQFASTGPYYVEKAGRPRVSRASVQFFLDWITAAETHYRENSKLDAARRASLLAEQASAREFFTELLSTANAE